MYETCYNDPTNRDHDREKSVIVTAASVIVIAAFMILIVSVIAACMCKRKTREFLGADGQGVFLTISSDTLFPDWSRQDASKTIIAKIINYNKQNGPEKQYNIICFPSLSITMTDRDNESDMELESIPREFEQ